MLHHRDGYNGPRVDGLQVRTGKVDRLRHCLRRTRVTRAERMELELGARLLERPGVTRPNTIAVASPKGGVGKTTMTFLLGNLLATHVKLRVLAVDLNPDFGTLARLAPDSARVEPTLVDVLHNRHKLTSGAELLPYLSQLPSGLHLLAAPGEAEEMAQMTAELYDELLGFLSTFYDVTLLDLGTGMTGEVAQLAIGRCDQTVAVATTEWVAASQVLGVLDHLDLPSPTLVLNKGARPVDADAELARHLAQRGFARQVVVPHDEQLRAMLGTGTYSIAALSPDVRVAIKQLGLAVADQLS